MPAPGYILALLVTVCFTLATALQPRSLNLNPNRQSDSLLAALLGDGRRMFANHFFVKADVYFHSGYYPSLFQQSYAKVAQDKHMIEGEEENHSEAEEAAHEKAMDFLGQSQNWIDEFGRHFYSSRHSHLDKPGEAREILPWLQLSADLDPQRVDTYTVASYWLRQNMGRVQEAEQFLRQGLRANPDSYEILFELGKLYHDNYHDAVHARNIWEMALQHWLSLSEADKNPTEEVYEQIVANLAQVEEELGELPQALDYLEMNLQVSPSPDAIQTQIDTLKQKIAQAPAR